MNRIRDIIKEVVFPENLYCISCGSPIKKGNKYSLCGNCENTLLYNQPESCRRCGKFTEKKAPGFCENCIAHPPNYDMGFAALPYGQEARKIIYSLKYGGKGYLAKNIAFIINGAINSISDYDIIIPVPMHKDKRKLRGFCQTTLISKNLSEITHKSVVLNNLIRIRNTPAMSGLNVAERENNIKDAFSVLNPEELRGKKVLLIDDVLTTGSTANECAGLLKDAGAASVYLAVFAATYNNRLS